MLVTVKNKDGINWGITGRGRIVQNVRNLINIYQYEVAYNRTMGIASRLVDLPANIAMEQMKVNLAETLARYEPRAILKNVNCTADSEGDIEIEVVIEVA